MELWIRTQDKDSLIKIEKIELIYDYLCSDYIQLIHIETDKGRIGSYSTQERALEILDEIQEHIQKQGQSYILTDEKGQPAGLKEYGNIYEMPEK